MEIDHYIDWQNAKQMLLDCHSATEDAIRLCNVMLAKAGSVTIHDELTTTLLDSMELTDGQIEQLSETYMKLAGVVKFAAEPLTGAEITNGR